MSEEGSRSPRLLLALSSLAHFVNDGTTFFVPVIAALLAELRGFSTLDVTVLFVVYYLTSSLFGLVIGWWADRRGRPGTLMSVGIGVLALGLFGFYVALAGVAGPSDFVVSLLAGAVTGFATSFYHPLGASILQRAYPPERRGTALGINGAFGSLGRALYPSLFALVALALVTSDSILLFAAVALGAAVLIRWGVRPSRPNATIPTPSTALGARDSMTTGIVRLTALSFFRSMALMGIAVWIPTYLTVARGVSAGGSLGLAVTVMYVGGILGQPVFGLAAGRLDRRLLIGISSAGASVGTLLYLGSSGMAAQGLLFTIGFFTFSAFPLLMSLSAEYVPKGSSTLANAAVFGLGSGGGGTVGPLVVGALAAASFGSIALGFEVMAVLGIVAAFLVVLLPRGGRAQGKVLFG